MELHHKILIIDSELVKPLDFESRKKMTTAFVADLLRELNMKELGSLQILDAVDETFPGWSFVQPITTSHISGHYFEEKDAKSHIHLDIYSCKEFDWHIVLSCANTHFALDKWSASIVRRTIDIHGRNSNHFSGQGESIN